MDLKGYFYGVRVIVTEHLGTYVPKRKHKKRRIQKKWVKRYGNIFKPLSTLAIAKLNGEDVIFCHPKYWDKYKKILEKEKE